MADISDSQSLATIPKWLDAIQERATISNPTIIVLLNKSDLEMDQSVTQNWEKRLQRDGIVYRDISLRFNIKTTHVINELAAMLL